MAKDPLRYVVENVLAIDDVQTVLLALGQIGIVDIYDLVFLGAESLDYLTLRDPKTPDNHVKVKLGYRIRIRAFQSFIAHLEATGTLLVDIEWLTLTNDKYESYRTLIGHFCIPRMIFLSMTDMVLIVLRYFVRHSSLPSAALIQSPRSAL